MFLTVKIEEWTTSKEKIQSENNNLLYLIRNPNSENNLFPKDWVRLITMSI